MSWKKPQLCVFQGCTIAWHTDTTWRPRWIRGLEKGCEEDPWPTLKTNFVQVEAGASGDRSSSRILGSGTTLRHVDIALRKLRMLIPAMISTGNISFQFDGFPEKMRWLSGTTSTKLSLFTASNCY